jgi:hypothetical protein
VIVRLLIYALLLVAVPGGCVVLIARPLLRELRARRAGRLNADRTCLLDSCGDAVEPDSRDAIYEDGHWMHRRCRRQLLGQ